jgi:hypothetical protein
MDRSDGFENVHDSIRVNREFDSNEIDQGDLQYKKHHESRIITFCAISINRSDEGENAPDSIRGPVDGESEQML